MLRIWWHKVLGKADLLNDPNDQSPAAQMNRMKHKLYLAAVYCEAAENAMAWAAKPGGMTKREREILASAMLLRPLKDAREAVRMEPYRESGYRRLMRMQVRSGDRGEAIRSYLECKRLLESELGVGPSEETESLYREIAGQAV